MEIDSKKDEDGFKKKEKDKSKKDKKDVKGYVIFGEDESADELVGESSRLLLACLYEVLEIIIYTIKLKRLSLQTICFFFLNVALYFFMMIQKYEKEFCVLISIVNFTKNASINFKFIVFLNALSECHKP